MRIKVWNKNGCNPKLRIEAELLLQLEQFDFNLVSDQPQILEK